MLTMNNIQFPHSIKKSSAIVGNIKERIEIPILTPQTPLTKHVSIAVIPKTYSSFRVYGGFRLSRPLYMFSEKIYRLFEEKPNTKRVFFIGLLNEEL